jgi:TRAP-type C4-dicarboxylate transport system permease small subunit
MLLDVLWGVFTRYALGRQADWSEELARFLLVWIGILGAAYASGQQQHLSIDLIFTSLNQKYTRWLLNAIYMLVAVFAILVMIVGGLRLMYITQVLGQLSAALRIPMYCIYAVLPLSGCIVVFYQLHYLARQKEKT